MGKVVEMPRAAGEPWERLNKEQRAAVTHGDGPLLVVAGAGTGKTRVITERIRHLLESRPELSGENILGLTFTEKAAAEMKHRVVAAVGDRGAGVNLGTFHAFCYELLRDIRPGLELLENLDHWILLRRNLPRLELKRYLRLADPGRFLGDFLQFFSRCQDELVPPERYQQYAEELAADFAHRQAALDEEARAEQEAEVARQLEIARGYRESDALLRERNLSTFGMLLLDSVSLLRTNSELLGLLRERYRYILVDEFQDTNVAQIELLYLLAGARRNIVAVGDDDQAIYRFRGASFGSFKLFVDRFLQPHGISPETGTVSLERNYRSTERILRVAGQVIRNNQDRFLPRKRLVPSKPAGRRVRIAEFADPGAEARWVAAEIQRLRDAGRRWGDFAVLYRAHAHRDRLVAELARRRIPFVIRKLSILESRLVRDAIAYLRLIASPGDDVACTRVLAAPAWDMQPTDLLRLLERTRRNRERSLWDELTAAQQELPFRERAPRTAALVEWVSELRRRARAAPATELLSALLEGMSLNLTAEDPERHYLDRFVRFVADWERRSDTKRLAELVEYVGYMQEAGEAIELEEEAVRNAVQLMTVHAAKGLEYPCVFVLRMVQNHFPTTRRRPVIEFPEKLMQEALPQGDFHIQEERRLFYVALTRAREELTLTTVVAPRSRASVFLEDILMDAALQKSDVEQLTPEPPPAALEPPPLELLDPATAGSRAHSRIGEWAATAHPPAAEPLQLSASAIDVYRKCPQRYLFGSVWGLRGGPRAAMTFGNVMHATIRALVREVARRRRVPFEEVETIYRREWTSAGFTDDYQQEQYRAAGLEQLRAFHETYCAAPPEVLHTEKAFELPLEDNIVVLGRMDQINRAGDGAVEIVDYKTGQPRLEKDADKNLQLSLYALAVRELLELEPARLVFYNLTTNDAVASSRDDAALAQARAAVQEVAADIRARRFAPQPGYHCRSCEFAPLCPAMEKPATPPARE